MNDQLVPDMESVKILDSEQIGNAKLEPQPESDSPSQFGFTLIGHQYSFFITKKLKVSAKYWEPEFRFPISTLNPII